ncbi:CHASE2 domain-containing protein [Prosthecobacter sp.]|uniref:CHASE2 domain-containing protein n=1 Tax=Prosthecobacter sp. TaxID=1965333 RepID=UPI003783ED74
MKGLLHLKARAILGGLAGMAFAALAWSGVLDTLENLTVDYRLRLRRARPVADDVRLVGIGDRDVGSQLGRWPFPRAVHGDVLNILSAAGARHTTFDVLFTEPSADAEQDARLKAAISQQPKVTLAYYFEHVEPSAAVQTASENRAHFIKGASRHGLNVNGLRFVRGFLPVPPFAELPAGYGAVNVVPDADGVIRRVPLFFAHEGRLYPSLAMQTVIDALNLRDDQISIIPGQEVTLVDTPRGTLHIPIDARGEYRINFLGDLGVFTPAFEYLDLYRAVESREMAAELGAAVKDRIVLVGLVSTGNSDVVSSSIGRLPGVAVQATVVSNILSGSHLRFLPRWLQVLLIVAAGAGLGVCMIPVRPWFGIMVFVLGVLAWSAVVTLAASGNFILPLVPVLLAFGVATLVMLGLEAAAMKQDRSRLVSVLGRYIAKPVLERAVDAEKPAGTSTERSELTVFFSDIRGFNAWAERAEPGEVAERLNEYFAVMTPLIERHGGTLDKLIGDCIMAFFGAPTAQPDHALRAVRMAQEMQAKMHDLNREWERRGYEPWHVGMGLHTAFVTVGHFGSSSFMDYTIVGPGVHVAARIQNITPPGKIWISAKTHAMVMDQVRSAQCSSVDLKGGAGPMHIFEVGAAGP